MDGYEAIDGFADDSYFENLNKDNSGINILMGSRSFYEGWDSNRPNVITFVNIGTGTDARKFILQAVGRGVRVQPTPAHRRRLQALYNAKEFDKTLYRQIKDHVSPLETVFIFGTNRTALQTVIGQLKQAGGPGGPEHLLTLAVNQDVAGRLLLIPVYRQGGQPLIEQRAPKKFELAKSEVRLLQDYVEYLGSDRLLLARHNASPRQIGLLRRVLAKPDTYFNTANGRLYGSLDILLSRLFGYFNLIPQEFDQLKPLEDEINHFKHIKVQLEDITELQTKIDRVSKYRDPAIALAELQARVEAGEISMGEGLKLAADAGKIANVEQFARAGFTLEIHHVANHYYVPLILSDSEKIDYIKHIIRHQSEVKFIRDLEAYLAEGGDAFKPFDWWLFSKLDESLDAVYIPYYDPNENRMRKFNPDFIFWLQKGNNYYILFVDPKGTTVANYGHKIRGFQELFETGAIGDTPGKPRPLDYDGLVVRVYCALHTADASIVASHRRYWLDSPAEMVQRIIEINASK